MDRVLISIMVFYYFYIVILLFRMFLQRKAAVERGELKLKHFRSYHHEFPEDFLVKQNHISNQFQLPLIFFVACLLNLQQDAVTPVTLGLAALFVLLRVLHTLIHLGSNNVLRRAFVYFLGVLTVGILMLLPLLR